MKVKAIAVARVDSEGHVVRPIIKPEIRNKLLEYANYTCQKCGQIFPEHYLAIDHIYPFSKGGGDKLSNYRVLCKSCNSRKRYADTLKPQLPIQLRFPRRVNNLWIYH